MVQNLAVSYGKTIGEPPPLPIHVMHLEGRQTSAKVRSFIELLVDQLRGNNALTDSK